MGSRLPRVLCLAVMSFFPAASLAQQASPRPLITQPINESQVVTLRGNTHPLAQPRFDIGIAPPNLPMQRMLLVLKRDPQQQFALHKLFDDQQDKGSPNYHRWLTPDEFGVQFGPSDQDLQLVTGWLQSHGFQVNRISHGRTVIEFTGMESQVEQAFHTQIHQYLVNGQLHWANASDPQIPAALAPAVAGVLSLNNFPRRSMTHRLGTYSSATRQLTPINPQFTLGYGCYPNGTCYAVGPADFGAVYNVQTLWNSGIDGTGQTIAIVGESDINIQDTRDFRTAFGLPAKDPNIIYDGPNPGLMPDEGEANIDVQWSGAIAPKATIDFVVAESTETTAGVDLSALYIIDHNLAPVMSESYGLCELGVGTAGNQFYNSLWAQAAAQGITAILASGDSGSPLCDFQGGPAQFGLAVSGLASTPFNVAIGGTDFNDFLHETQYWNSTNTSPTQQSAKGYIPETTWDLSCTNNLFLAAFGFGSNAENNCNDPQIINAGLLILVGGSGGVSTCTVNNGSTPSSCSGGYAKPSWQVAPGVPPDGKRDLPDVSLFASNGVLNSFYVFCQADSSANCSFGQYAAAGGTSFGAPAFAGIMALVNQQMHAPQGNANYVLYKLASQQNAASCNSSTGPGSTCVFNDITNGTIAMPCVAGSPNCVVKTAGHRYGVLSGYSTGTGYDLATGLGSINVGNLVNKWSSVTFRSTNTTLGLSPTTNLTHGQPVTVTASVAPGSGSPPPTPSGAISLLTSTGVRAGNFTLSGSGAASSTTNLLPGGSYTVTAHYAGDNTYGGSDSAPVSITIGKENSSPQIELVTWDWQGNLISANASTAVYGSPYLLRVDVLNSVGSLCQNNGVPQSGCPTGNINLTDNGSALDGGVFGLNSLGYTEDQIVQFPGGNNSVKAQYAGDNSFNASSTTTAYSITSAKTTINVPAVQVSSVGSPFFADVTIQSQSFGAAPTGTVTFISNGSPVPGTVSYQSTPGSLSNPTANLYAHFSSSASAFSAPGKYTITASYSGDANYGTSASPGKSITVKYPNPIIWFDQTSFTVPAGASVTLTATVNTGLKNVPVPSGPVSFTYYTPATGQPVGGTTTYSPTTDSSGNVALQATVTFIPIPDSIIALSYNGDNNYPPAYQSGGGAQITVTGSDFAIVPLSSSVSVPQGTPAYVQFAIQGQSNYTGTINFLPSSCTGLPKESSCSFQPTSMTGIGGILLTITTTTPHSVASRKVTGWREEFILALLFTPIGAVLLIGFPRRRAARGARLSFIGVLLLMVLGCGGGGGGGGGGHTDPGTPKGSYPITVTATSGSGSSAITHTAMFSLVVQ
jgi:subtilase family serine protease